MKSFNLKYLSLLAAFVSYEGLAEQVTTMPPIELVGKPLTIEQIKQKRKEGRRKLRATIENKEVTANVVKVNNNAGPTFLKDINNISAPSGKPSFIEKPVKPSFLDKVKAKWKPNLEYDLKPKGNIAVPVAAGLTNRISTNFKMVAIKTHDDNSIIELEDGIIYITLKRLAPVGLLIFEEGVPSSAVNVTLFPFDGMLPTMVDVNVKTTKEMKLKGKSFREYLEKEEKIALATKSITIDKYIDKYTNRINMLLTTVAKGEIPRGFTLTTKINKKDAVNPCSMPIENVIAQQIIGGREIIDVVLVKNNSNRVYTVKEEQCYHNDALAAAVFQRSLLQPGQYTEMYILRDKMFYHNQKSNKTRPVLVN